MLGSGCCETAAADIDCRSGQLESSGPEVGLNLCSILLLLTDSGGGCSDEIHGSQKHIQQYSYILGDEKLYFWYRRELLG